jgi:glycosyltransferase involved in cell wall biosynthesis
LVALYRALRRADADVYITSSPRKLPVLKPLLYSLRRPLVFHVASDTVVEIPPNGFTGIRRKLYDWALQSIATVVAQTPYQATQIRDHWNTVATVISNGYPPANVVDTHDSRKYFLWVGRLIETTKRPHIFLDVAEAIPDEQFLLIGPRKGQTEYTNALIERASCLENVQYLGPVAPSEIHDYYRRALAVINTSDFEGFPNTFLEAWRYATPVLSLSVDTRRFLADGGETGFANGQFETLVSLAQELADNPERRRALGKHGMETFESRYRLSTVVESYRELLQSVIAGA